jgi:RHS repeat-associated protein
MEMPGRDTIFKTGYRYGFNGKEMDNETYGGQGNEYDYGFRIYNPRIGRFLSVDPLTQYYPQLNPYQFSSNNPIEFVDIDGLEASLPKVIGNTWPKTQNLTSKEVEDNINSLNITGIPLSYVKGLLVGEGLSLSLYDVDRNDRTTAKSHGGNATVGIGHLVHYGAIGSTQYDKNALTEEQPYSNGIGLSEAFTLFASDVQMRVKIVDNSLTNNKITDIDQNAKAVLVDLEYNSPGSVAPAMEIYKKGVKYGGSYSGDVELSAAIGSGTIQSITPARRDLRLRSIQKAILKDAIKNKVSDDPRDTKKPNASSINVA